MASDRSGPHGRRRRIFQRPVKGNGDRVSISARFGIPDFRNKIGVHYEIRTALKHMCQLCIKQDKNPLKGEFLLLIIDDLDRCSPTVVKSTLDAVRLVANVERVVTLVAIDQRIAYSAAIKHFEQFPRLDRSPEAIAREYLAKVFQVAITLPDATAAATRRFIYEELFHGNFQPSNLDVNRSNAKNLSSTPAQDFLIGEIGESLSDKYFSDSLPEEVEMFFVLANACGFSNPRQLWRLKQAWQLMKGISFREGINAKSLKPWMRALFLCEYILQADVEDSILISNWISSPSEEVPRLLNEIALGDSVRDAFSDYFSRAEVVKHVLLPSAPK